MIATSKGTWLRNWFTVPWVQPNIYIICTWLVNRETLLGNEIANSSKSILGHCGPINTGSERLTTSLRASNNEQMMQMFSDPLVVPRLLGSLPPPWVPATAGRSRRADTQQTRTHSERTELRPVEPARMGYLIMTAFAVITNTKYNLITPVDASEHWLQFISRMSPSLPFLEILHLLKV